MSIVFADACNFRHISNLLVICMFKSKSLGTHKTQQDLRLILLKKRVFHCLKTKLVKSANKQTYKYFSIEILLKVSEKQNFHISLLTTEYRLKDIFLDTIFQIKGKAKPDLRLVISVYCSAGKHWLELINVS